MPTIRGRLREIAGVALSSLRLVSAINLIAVVALLAATLWAQRTSSAAQDVTQLSLLAERQRSLVARVPAEMDLARQADLSKRFEETSDLLAAGAAVAGLNIEGDLKSARDSGKRVFALAGSFAQQQAMALSDGEFSDTTNRIHAQIMASTERASASVFRALVGMLVLGASLLGLQWFVGARAHAQLVALLESVSGTLSKSIEESAASAERIAAGRLGEVSSHRASETEETSRLQKALHSMEVRLKDVLGEIQLACETLHFGAQQVSSSAQALSLGTASQAASMQQTTTSVLQMTTSITQNAELSRLAEDLASKNVSGARAGTEGMRATSAALREVVDKASVIGELAHRTHLLSLNAAIEAARAGEHGRGFSVIALEVRSLASRSSTALTEIRKVAESSIETVERTASAIGQLLPASEKAATAAVQVVASSAEQMAGAQQIDRAIRDIETVTQAAAASSEELAATAEAISHQASRLRSTASYFRLENNSGPMVFSESRPVAHENRSLVRPMSPALRPAQYVPS
jgi:methyl-accepting chemotaxis protein